MNRMSQTLDPRPLFPAHPWSPQGHHRWRAWFTILFAAALSAVPAALLLGTITTRVASAPVVAVPEPAPLPEAPAEVPPPPAVVEPAPLVLRVQGPPLVIRATVARKPPPRK
jgi:hypothetical protein